MTHKQENIPYSIKDLENYFQAVSEKTDWDLTKKMVWGYFFTDSDKSKLEKVRKVLEMKGYRFIEIIENNKGEYWLQVEKAEIHTISSLNKRNHELHALAIDCDLCTYDGMDVGPLSVHSV